MSGNPAYDLFRDFEQQIINSFNYESVIFMFPRMQVTAGIEQVDLTYAMPLGFSSAEKELIARTLESFRSKTGEYVLPMIQKTIVLTQDEYDLMASKGQLNGYMARLGAEIAANADRELVFNNGLTLQQKPFYGLNDLGSGAGTVSRPIPASGNATLTKAGLWTTATFADLDRSALSGAIHKFYDFRGPLTLFYPACAESAFEQGVPSSTVGQIIRPLFAQSFPRMVPLPDDENGQCISTKTAETKDDFRLIACNTSKFVFAAPRAPVVRIRDERASNTPRIYIDYEVYGGLIPVPFIAPNGTIYKAMADMDDVNNT
jgi:hypothetical protein